MKFYVIRHPLTESNAADINQGWGDSSLTPEGVEAAEKLGNFFKDKLISIIYTSDLGRCVETSQIINKILDIKIIKAPQLKEQNFGQFNNFYTGGKEFKEFYKKGYSVIPAGGESFLQMKARVLNFIRTQLSSNLNNLLIVTHEGCFRAILSETLAVEIDSEKCKTTQLTVGLFELKDSVLEFIQKFDLS